MKILIAPDSFKHSLSATEACRAMTEGVRDALPNCEVVSLPVADGGEGSVDALLFATEGKRVTLAVSGPRFDKIDSFYAQIGDTAVVELAAAAGLMQTSNPNPEETTTFGVGELILHALDSGLRRLVLCIGGSATNDAGLGAFCALGARLLDADGAPVSPTGGSLSKIAAIDTDSLDKRLSECSITIACDVTNPLYGERGAAHVFAPQKGADTDAVCRLDDGLRNVASLLLKHSGRDVASIPGCGAAGGFAAPFLAYTDAKLQSGIDLVLSLVGFDRHLAGADLILTGEGKTDAQTLGGKVPVGVARRSGGLPVIAISGSVDDNVDDALYQAGITAVFASVRLAREFSEIKRYAAEWLRAETRNVMRAYVASK